VLVAFSFDLIANQHAFAQKPVDISKGLSLSDISGLSQSMNVDENIYLNVIVNDEVRNNMSAFRQKENGDFIIPEEELKAIGLVAARKAQLKNGWIDLSALPDITHSYDSGQNAIACFFRICRSSISCRCLYQ